MNGLTRNSLESGDRTTFDRWSAYVLAFYGCIIVASIAVLLMASLPIAGGGYVRGPNIGSQNAQAAHPPVTARP